MTDATKRRARRQLEVHREALLQRHPDMPARRQAGHWPAWTIENNPEWTEGDWHASPGNPQRSANNVIFDAFIWPTETEGGVVQHAAIRCNFEPIEPGWRELQRIKDEVLGPQLVAVQVYPRSDDVTDGADLYHLWCLPPGAVLPFSLRAG